MMNGGRASLDARIHSIAVTHSRLPASLQKLCFSIVFCSSNNACTRDYIYRKPYLIIIIDIVGVNTILNYGLLDSVKPLLNRLWVFVLSALVVIAT